MAPLLVGAVVEFVIPSEAGLVSFCYDIDGADKVQWLLLVCFQLRYLCMPLLKRRVIVLNKKLD
jgi:hypothetical protein